MRRSIPPTLVLLALAVAACGAPRDTVATPTTVGGVSVTGYVHAGPVCPVVSNPPDPACADRPVGDALIVVEDPSGATVAEIRTGSDGRFMVRLAPGAYTLVPQAVDGLMGTASSQEVILGSEPISGLDFAYDTGIR